MEYGVYTSEQLEIAQSKLWTLCFYSNHANTFMGVKLFKGSDNDKTLTAICERDNTNNKTVYAYEMPSGEKQTNDKDGVYKQIGDHYDYDIIGLMKIDNIEIIMNPKMPTVSESDIKTCLKNWRMGTSYQSIYNGVKFQMVTNKIEYIFMIQNDNCNIYCGASVNVPCENGMLGGNQYFRLRNYADNSQPFCRFYSKLGNEINVLNSQVIVCESGKCTNTPQGLFWPVKRFNDDEIILDGCGGDEYIYQKDILKSEYFGSNA